MKNNNYNSVVQFNIKNFNLNQLNYIIIHIIIAVI